VRFAFARSRKDRLQAQLKGEREVVILAENRSQPVKEKAVRPAGIPGHFEMPRRVPLKKRGVAVGEPAIRGRGRGEVLKKIRRGGQLDGHPNHGASHDPPRRLYLRTHRADPNSSTLP
jgi:hypothetical protein